MNRLLFMIPFMNVIQQFPDITRANVALAPLTHLRIGGPAEFLVEPRNSGELSEVLKWCRNNQVQHRVLGSGVNLVIRDETIPGVVIRMVAPAFTSISVDGTRVRAGCGAKLTELIAVTARNNLTGFESLIGIPATVGGALRCNAGDRAGEIGSFVNRIEVLEDTGEVVMRERDELRFAEHSSNLDDAVLLNAEFELQRDSADAIVKRIRKAWIQHSATQPYPHQAAARVFLNPRGATARELLEKAGLARSKIGGAEVSDRNANYIMTHPGATANDVLQLMDKMRTSVRASAGIELQPELVVW